MSSPRLVVIMRGISGSGKSTFVRNNFPNDAVVCSADHYFMDAEGNYNWRADGLTAAHDACFAKFSAALDNGEPVVIVDNTNLKVWQVQRYYTLAESSGYTVRVIRMVTDPSIAAGRNVHGVPPERVQQMQDGFEPWPGEILCTAGVNIHDAVPAV